MKGSTRSQASRSRTTASRPSRSSIPQKTPSRASSRKARVSKPTYFSLLKDVEHALKHEHVDGASLRKLKLHLEKKYGAKFDAEACKMFKSAVNRLHKKRRIKRHPTKEGHYKFKPPITHAHHIFGTPAQRRAGRKAGYRPGAKRLKPNRSSRSTRRR